MTDTTKTWTVDEMLSEEPCEDYTKKAILTLWNGRESLSLPEILDLNIPDEDKVWVVCLPNAFEKQQEWIDEIVDDVVREFALVEPSTKEWAKKWLSGEDRSAVYASGAARASYAARAAEAARAARAAAYALGAGAARASGAARAAEAARAAGAGAARQLTMLKVYLIPEDNNEHRIYTGEKK